MPASILRGNFRCPWEEAGQFAASEWPISPGPTRAQLTCAVADTQDMRAVRWWLPVGCLVLLASLAAASSAAAMATVSVEPAVCSGATNCTECLQVPGCGWCAASRLCLPGTLRGPVALVYPAPPPAREPSSDPGAGAQPAMCDPEHAWVFPPRTCSQPACTCQCFV